METSKKFIRIRDSILNTEYIRYIRLSASESGGYKMIVVEDTDRQIHHFMFDTEEARDEEMLRIILELT